MKDLRKYKGRRYIEDLIAEGEHEHQDFKYMISDARKIAKSISAFANNSGGRLLIGIKDNGTVAGVRNEEDIYVVEQAAERYCRPPQEIEFTAFNAGNGIVVIRASIAAASEKPVCAEDTDGQWKAYYRVADENILAHPLMTKAWQCRCDSDEGLMLSDTESRLVRLLEEAKSGLTVRDIAITLHVTTTAAEDMIVHLSAIGVIGFRYTGSGFDIVLDNNESAQPCG